MRGTTTRLGDMCDLITEPVRTGARPDALYLGLEHLAPGRLMRIGGGQASEMRSNTSAFQSGDVLYGKLRPYLDKAVLADSAGVCTTELLVLRPKPGVESRFLVAVVHSPDFIEHAVAGTTGVQHPRTSWAHVREFEVPALPPDKQRRMADLLWLVQETIAKSEALVSESQALRRVALRTLLAYGLNGEPQLETNIGPVPTSWKIVTVASIATVKGGKRMPKGISLSDENTGQPYIRVMDFKDHDVKTEQVLFVPRDHQSVLARYTIASTDIYISIAGTVGLVGQVPSALDGANLTENAAKISIADHGVMPRYVMYALASDTCQAQIALSTATNAQPKLALVRIEQIMLPVPPTLSEQLQIVTILEALGHKIGICCRKRVVLEALFKTLLHKIMSREIRAEQLPILSDNQNGDVDD